MADLTIDGHTFSFVQKRLLGGSVYRSSDGSHYLRTGPAEHVATERENLRTLRGTGAPAPDVVAHGVLDDGNGWTLETSVGQTLFTSRFSKDESRTGAMQEESVDALFDIAVDFFRAQLETQTTIDRDAFRKLLFLDTSMRTNMPLSISTDLLQSAWGRAFDRVAVLPWGVVHGDFNPHNVLEGGVIDYEFSGIGPVYYDIVNMAPFCDWFEPGMHRFTFSNERMTKLLTRADDVVAAKGLPSVTEYVDDLAFLKVSWGATELYDGPFNETKVSYRGKWRREFRDWAAPRYLAGESFAVADFRREQEPAFVSRWGGAPGPDPELRLG